MALRVSGIIAVSALSLVTALPAQEQTATVSVVDAAGMPIPFAVVVAGNATARVADDSGRALVPSARADSIRFRVRRIGYQAFYGQLPRSAENRYVVTLTALASTLATVTVKERASTPLANRGFYERVDRVQRGAIVGQFLTPEDLDEANASSVSAMLRRSRYARIVRSRPTRGPAVTVILGRGGCGMNVVLDGQLLTGTAQDEVEAEASTSINPGGSSRGRSGGNSPDIDQVIDARSVMAIEVYPSSANAPAELIPFGGDGACGIVAIWTGARR